jgi:hypothetical protein
MDFVERIIKIPFHKTVEGKLVVISMDDLIEEIEVKLDPIEDVIKINALKHFKNNPSE